MLQAVLVHGQQVPPVRSACELTVMRDVSPALFGIMSGSIFYTAIRVEPRNLFRLCVCIGTGAFYFFPEKRERKVYLETKLRNMKRQFSKMSQHADLAEECIELKCEIDSVERELKSIS